MAYIREVSEFFQAFLQSTTDNQRHKHTADTKFEIVEKFRNAFNWDD